MAITNTTPVTPGSTTIYWVTKLTLTPTTVSANLSPSDGTYLIGNPSMEKRVCDKTTPAIINEVFAAVQTLAKKTTLPTFVSVVALDPTKPFQLYSRFSDGQYNVTDLYAVISSNPSFASVYADMLTYLGGKI